MKDYLRDFIRTFALIMGFVLVVVVLIVPIGLIATSHMQFWWSFSISGLWAIIWISAVFPIFKVKEDDDDIDY